MGTRAGRETGTTHQLITILITAAGEPDTIGRALRPIIAQTEAIDVEIIVICPDDATAQAASVFDVNILRDQQRGKPAALNMGFKAAQGEIIIMSDGDVVIGQQAIDQLLKLFEDPQVGAASGRPISISPKDTMLGFWSHLLTDAGAHQERLKRDGGFFVCSGYLYAVRRKLIEYLPEDALAEDAVLSHMVGWQNYTIRYAPTAEVYVRYPATYYDWLKQKVRSAGGYAQPVIANSPLQMRSFRHEALAGLRVWAYPERLIECAWTALLFVARLHLWLLIFWRVRVLKTPLTQLWQRVESTKA